MRTFKVGVAGLRHPHAGAFLRSFRSLPEIELAAAWDEDAAARQNPDLTAGVGAVYDDYAAMLERDDLDFIAVLRPNVEAPAAAIQAAQAGKHLLVEKPMARTCAQLREVLAAARAAHVQVTTGYLWRYHPICRDIKGLLDAGELGRVWSCEARMVATTVKARGPEHWLFHEESSGGGILNWLGVHWIDLLRYLIGEIVAVSAITANVGGEDIDVEDVASVALRFANGAVGALYCGYLIPPGLPEGYDTELVLRGEAGWVAFNPTQSERTLHVRTTVPRWRAAPARDVTYRLQHADAYGEEWGLEHLRDFLRAVETGEPALVNGDEALRTLEVVEAIYESARTGRLVEVKREA
jgi:predicted dehydrogenase